MPGSAEDHETDPGGRFSLTTSSIVTASVGTIVSLLLAVLAWVGHNMAVRLDTLGNRMQAMEVRLVEQSAVSERVDDNRAELRAMRADFEQRLRALERTPR